MRRDPTAEGEPGHSCGQPACCGHGAAPVEAETVATQTGAALHRPTARTAPRWSQLKSWLIRFLAFFGIYASSSVCVFCGTPGCPVGAGGAALVGGVFSVLWRYGQVVGGSLTNFFKKVISKEVPHVAGRDQKL